MDDFEDFDLLDRDDRPQAYNSNTAAADEKGFLRWSDTPPAAPQVHDLQQQQPTKDGGTSATDNNNNYASVVPFSAVCELFERSSQTTKQAQKKRLLQTFFSHYHDDNYFPLIRLLLPQVLIISRNLYQTKQ